MIPIKHLFETHLEVSDLEKSIAFYETLGLTLAKRFETFAFFWIGHEKQMLGLWENKSRPVIRQHFAFSVDLPALLAARQVLLEQEMELFAAFGKEPVEPIVHTWHPGASLYFNDPDKNSLEFITELTDEPMDIPGPIYYSDWQELQGKPRVSDIEATPAVPTPILNLFETHLEVADLEGAVRFYEQLGLTLAKRFDTFAFFWIGSDERFKRKMLGIWEISDRPIVPQHTAFEVELDDLLVARETLLENGIEPVNEFDREPTEPIVHTWLPAASLYFKDTEGNLLEYITLLDGEPTESSAPPYYSEWLEMQKK